MMTQHVLYAIISYITSHNITFASSCTYIPLQKQYLAALNEAITTTQMENSRAADRAYHELHPSHQRPGMWMMRMMMLHGIP